MYAHNDIFFYSFVLEEKNYMTKLICFRINYIFRWFWFSGYQLFLQMSLLFSISNFHQDSVQPVIQYATFATPAAMNKTTCKFNRTWMIKQLLQYKQSNKVTYSSLLRRPRCSCAVGWYWSGMKGACGKTTTVSVNHTIEMNDIYKKMFWYQWYSNIILY